MSKGTSITQVKKNDQEMNMNLQKVYRSCVGSLLYIVKHSLPDLSNTVRELSKVNKKGKLVDLISMLQCCKFLFLTRNLGIQMERNLLSKDWIYKNIFKLSNQEFKTEQEETLEDAKFKFRVNQIENEGNDPLQTGESFGTPHDLASLYSIKRDKSVTNVPDGYEEEEPGRPKTKLTQYKTDRDTFGKDPLGQATMKSNDSLRVSDTNDVSTFQENQLFRHKNVLDSLRKKKPTLLKENEGLLDESQITGLE